MNHAKSNGTHPPSERIQAALLAQLPTFLAVAERRSFARAAKDLGMSASAVSQTVSRLERGLGAPLLVRTTRSVNLTEVGAALLAEAAPNVAAVARALESVSRRPAGPTGTLRLNAPRLACRTVLQPLIIAFSREHPEVHVDLVVDDANVDIVAEGFDAGVRLREAVHQDMVTTRLTPPMRFLVVGSKRYLEARGRPQHPRELVDHACLGWRSPTTGELYRWEFEQRGRQLEVAVRGPISSNHPDVLIAGVEAGLGLTYLAEAEIGGRLEARRLELVLEAFTPPSPGLFLYYPRSARNVPKVSAFVAFVKRRSRP